MPPVRVAAIQMVSGPEVAANLAAAARLIAEAARAGAKLAALPENFYLIGRHEGDKVAVREADGKGPVQDFLASAAKENRIWIIGGTAPISSEDDKRGACLVYDDTGRRVARYDKMHLFRFHNETERYDEARTLQAGTAPVALQSPFGRLALSVCYDVRFPELYAGSASLTSCLCPSAFTVPTGAAHWRRCCGRVPSRTRPTSSQPRRRHARRRPPDLGAHHDRRPVGQLASR